MKHTVEKFAIRDTCTSEVLVSEISSESRLAINNACKGLLLSDPFKEKMKSSQNVIKEFDRIIAAMEKEDTSENTLTAHEGTNNKRIKQVWINHYRMHYITPISAIKIDNRNEIWNWQDCFYKFEWIKELCSKPKMSKLPKALIQVEEYNEHEGCDFPFLFDMCQSTYCSDKVRKAFLRCTTGLSTNHPLSSPKWMTYYVLIPCRNIATILEYFYIKRLLSASGKNQRTTNRVKNQKRKSDRDNSDSNKVTKYTNGPVTKKWTPKYFHNDNMYPQVLTLRKEKRDSIKNINKYTTLAFCGALEMYFQAILRFNDQPDSSSCMDTNSDRMENWITTANLLHKIQNQDSK